MTQKEFIKQVEETKERFRKRFEDRGILTWEDISEEERNRMLGELGFNNYIVLEWKHPSVEPLALAHNRLTKKMKKLQKAYDEMEEAFEAYKKEVLKNG